MTFALFMCWGSDFSQPTRTYAILRPAWEGVVCANLGPRFGSGRPNLWFANAVIPGPVYNHLPYGWFR